MKTKDYILPLILFVPFWLFSQSVWNYVNPIPQENSLLAIKLIPETNKIIAVGVNSTVMVSQDEGDTWNVTHNPANIPNYIDCISVCFLDSQVGFIGTDYEKILKTTDAGVTWEVVYSIDSCSSFNRINDFVFINDTVGFAVGNYGLLLKTTNGGEYWTLVQIPAEFDLLAIEFLNESIGMSVGGYWGQMIKTIDGGNSWQIEQINFQSVNYASRYFDLFFFDENTGLMTGFDEGTMNNYGYIFKTDDGGDSWYEVFNSYSSVHPLKFDFINQTYGIATGFSLYFDTGILKSEDGGETWIEIILPTNNFWLEGDVCFLNENEVVMGGRLGSLYKSYDAGGTWESIQESYFSEDICQVQFVNEIDGFLLTKQTYAGGSTKHDLFKTDDGGNTWQSIIDDKYYASFCFANSYQGYFAYRNGGELEVLKTEDGGESWQIKYTDTLIFNSKGTVFYNSNIGLVFSEDKILKTMSGGQSWSDITPAFKNIISDLAFRTHGNIFVIGTNSNDEFRMLETSDGGLSWQISDLQINGAGEDIVFVDENIGFIACSNSTIYKTTDGGNIWYETLVNNNNPIELHAIDFPTEYVGYAVGNGLYETIMKTIDGGETWNVISSGTSSGLNCVQFFDNEIGLVFGDRGVILKTTNGGVTGFECITTPEPQSPMLVYPNPFRDCFIIKFSLPKNMRKSTLNIYSLNGCLINSYYENFNNNQIKINANYLKPGAYLIELKLDNIKSELTKIVKLN